MNKLLTIILLAVMISGCAIFQDPAKQQVKLENIQELKVRLMSNEPLEVTPEEVIDRYQSYLSVSTEAEIRIRVAHRIASLKLQAEELEMDRLAEAADEALRGDGDQSAEAIEQQQAELLAQELAEEAQATREERNMALSSIKDYEALLK